MNPGTLWQHADLCWCSVLRSSSQASSVLNCGWSRCSTGSVASCSPSKLAWTTRLRRGLFGKCRPEERETALLSKTCPTHTGYNDFSPKSKPENGFNFNVGLEGKKQNAALAVTTANNLMSCRLLFLLCDHFSLRLWKQFASLYLT